MQWYSLNWIEVKFLFFLCIIKASILLQRKLQRSMSASQVCGVAQSVCWYLGLCPLAGVWPTLTAAHCWLCHLLTTLSWAGETESDPHNILLQRVTVMQRLFLTVTDCYNSIDNWYSSVISDLWPRCKHCSIKLETLSTHSLLQASADCDCLRRGQRESLSTIDSSCSTFSFSVVILSHNLIILGHHKKWTTSLWPKTKKINSFQNKM